MTKQYLLPSNIVIPYVVYHAYRGTVNREKFGHRESSDNSDSHSCPNLIPSELKLRTGESYNVLYSGIGGHCFPNVLCPKFLLSEQGFVGVVRTFCDLQYAMWGWICIVENAAAYRSRRLGGRSLSALILETKSCTHSLPTN